MVEMQKIHAAAKFIWADGTEGFQAASAVVGPEIALGMLTMFLWESRNPGRPWPENVDTIDAVNKTLEESGILSQLVSLETTAGAPVIFQLFVRWSHAHADAGGTVELARNGKIILSERIGNNDRVYGFCIAIVTLLRKLGNRAEMPRCLQGHTGPNRNRED